MSSKSGNQSQRRLNSDRNKTADVKMALVQLTRGHVTESWATTYRRTWSQSQKGRNNSTRAEKITSSVYDQTWRGCDFQTVCMSKSKRVSRNKSHLAGTKFLTTNPATKIKSIPSRWVQCNRRKINLFFYKSKLKEDWWPQWRTLDLERLLLFCMIMIAKIEKNGMQIPPTNRRAPWAFSESSKEFWSQTRRA